MSSTDETETNSEDLIVVGSSAGGVEALSILVSTLPDNFPAPIVLAQHLDPNHSSSLDAILQRRTRLPVEVITSSNHLQAGRIYVVPANRHVSIKDHRVEVHEDRSKRPRPSINALLSTAAESYGDRLIAVILTGSGSDGAIGAVDVKNAGGIVIVQDPQTARYPSMPLALPPTIVDFEHVDYGYRVSKTLRQMVIFGQQDLSRSAPFPRIDLVLCRNVLIYFTSDLQDYVLNQFAFSLSPDGYLFLGKAETVRPAQSFYELVNKHWKVYHCTGNPLPSIRQLVHPNMSGSSLESSAVNHPSNTVKQHVAQDIPPTFELGQLRRFNELILRYLPIGVIVIDRSYRILTANGAARRLLGLRDVTGGEQDFLHAVRGIPYQETREAIDAVFRERNPLNLPEVVLDTSSGGNGRFVNISISLMQMEGGSPDLATMSVSDVTQQVQIRRQLETTQIEQTHLMNELSIANKRLSDVNKELMDANEELQVSNEELVLTHEELQASIEEFETTNEELQATNEELETNNEELQATNEELETTNDELRARTNDLQELTTTLENERVRLAEMVALAPFYILVLRGPTLLIEAFNPRYTRFVDSSAVQGRPLDEVIDLFWEAGVDVIHLARDAYKMDATFTTPRMLTLLPSTQDPHNGDTEEAFFEYTIVPSHDASGKVDGVIIYTTDETKKQQREVEEGYQRSHLSQG